MFCLTRSLLQQVRAQLDVTAECGSTMGCFSVPTSCVRNHDCSVFLTFAPDHDGVTFEISTSLTQGDVWIACGMSESAKMVRAGRHRRSSYPLFSSLRNDLRKQPCFCSKQDLFGFSERIESCHFASSLVREKTNEPSYSL